MTKLNGDYSLAVLKSLSDNGASVPILWFYEIGNALVMAFHRKRITSQQIDGFLTRLKALPINAVEQTPSEILELHQLARRHGLTNYDAAYLALAMRLNVPLATADARLGHAAANAGVSRVAV